MFHPEYIKRLYAEVSDNEIKKNNIKEDDIRDGVRNMSDLYAPDPTRLATAEAVSVPDFNMECHRIAYLHKYAGFHTALVYDMMSAIILQRCDLFKGFLTSGQFKLCSLGGGPGSDAIGAFAALNNAFGTFKMDVTVVDIMENWKYTFTSIVNHLFCNTYGSLQMNVGQTFLNPNYIVANLFSTLSNEVTKAIEAANLITMIKFVSAAACKDTETMIEKIVNVMKKEALLLFIDNAAGGFHQMMKRVARDNGLISVFGPLPHFKYCKEEMKTFKFGYSSCFMSTVTVQLFQKQSVQYSNKKNSCSFITKPPIQVNHRTPLNSKPLQLNMNITPSENCSHNNIVNSTNLKPSSQNCNLNETAHTANLLARKHPNPPNSSQNYNTDKSTALASPYSAKQEFSARDISPSRNSKNEASHPRNNSPAIHQNIGTKSNNSKTNAASERKNVRNTNSSYSNCAFTPSIPLPICENSWSNSDVLTYSNTESEKTGCTCCVIS